MYRWPRPNRWLQRMLFATHSTWQKKLAVTKPENKFTDNNWGGGFGLTNWQSRFGAHLHSWTTLEDTGTREVHSQRFDPWPCLCSSQTQLYCTPHPLLSPYMRSRQRSKRWCCCRAEPLKHTVNAGVNNDKARYSGSTLLCFFLPVFT